MIEIISGICPLSDTEVEIEVKYLKVSAIGGQGYKKNTFRCDDSRDSETCVNCPIYLSAPVSL